MRVLLVHPPVPTNVARNRCESLGIGYIASVLRRDGLDVNILDAQLLGLRPGEAVREIRKREFDVVGFTAMHRHKDPLIALVRAARKSRKDAVIAVGGYLPTIAPEPLLAACPEIDFLLRGEGEIAASEVFGRLARGDDWRDSPGVAYMKDGALVSNAPPALVADLDTIPWPARDGLKQVRAVPWIEALVSSSRGCQNRCSYCCIHAFYSHSGGHAPRFRQPERFVDEIESVVSEIGIRSFGFVDDNFIGPGEKAQERAQAVAREIISRKLGVQFSIECRADEVREDTLKLLKEAGCTCVFLGIESGVQRQLDTFNKRMTVEQNRAAIELVRSVGLNMQPGFILFDPYTTVDELQESMRFVKETGMYGGPMPIWKVILYQGAPLTEQVRADGLLKDSGGIDIDYKFKNPGVSMSWKVARFSDSINKFRQRLSLRREKNVLDSKTTRR